MQKFIPNFERKGQEYWRDIYGDWKRLVNMNVTQLESFLKSPEGEEAGLSEREAGELGIRRGRDSARAIIRMKRKGVKNWNRNDWFWARAQVRFLNRFLNKNERPRHKLWNKKGEATRYLLALLIWGHDPTKRRR